jgi:hypothetical protein
VKQFLILFLISASASFCQAQIKVDSNYTILANGIKGQSEIISKILGDLSSITIRENASGKVCTPTSAQYTIIIQSESFHAQNARDAEKYLNRAKPKDRIIIDGIVLPQNCFAPPKQIVITII